MRYKFFCLLTLFGIILFQCSNNSNYFQTFADNHTVSLWLFDETEYDYTTLADAGLGGYDLRLMPEGHLVPGKFGNCLNLAGGSSHAIAYAGFAGKVVNNHIRRPDGIVSGLWGPTEGPEYLLHALAGDDWTCEFWFNLKEIQGDITIIDMGQGYQPGFSVRLTIDKGFEIINSYSGHRALSPINIMDLTDERWHHVAFVQSGSTVSYFLDGKKLAGIHVTSIPRQSLPDLQKPEDREHEHRDFESMNFEQRRQNRFNITIGHPRQGGNIMYGMMDELRFSNVVRYAKDFDLPSTFARKFGAYGAKPSEPAVPHGLPVLFGGEKTESPLQFGLRKYLFIDDAIVDSADGVHITMNSPTNKQKIDFVPRKSAWRPTAVDMGDMVYLYVPEGYSAGKGRTYLFTSTDGIHFTEHDESPVIDEIPLYGTFFKDTNPDVPDEERFKLTAWVGNRGICLYLSPDGIHWRRNETLMLPLVSGGGAETFYDDQRGEYITFIRRDASFQSETCPGGSRAGVMFKTSEPLKTWPFIPLDHPYFEGWTLPCVTCEGPTIISKKSSGQAYRTRAIKYPWAADTYLAFVWRYPRHLGDDPPRHVDLGVSRDASHWKFFEPTQGWYIPVEDDADPEQISIYGLIRRNNDIWQYTDHGGAHGGDAPRTYYRWTQRLDGFVSLDGTGIVVTRPLVLIGKDIRLVLNSTGSVKIAILDEKGKEIGGFGLADCDLIPNAIDHVVTWAGISDLSKFSNKTIRIKFKMVDTKLFAFEFTGKKIQ